MAAVIRSGPAARRAAVIEMSRIIVVRALATSPRDTNRYFNGWAQAGNSAGIGRFPVLALNRSSKWSQIKYALEKQLEWWTMLDARYRAQGRKDRWARQAAQKVERAREELRRFYQSNSAIGINIYTNSYDKPVRALPKAYGGRGQVVDLAGGRGTVVQLHNREAHASFVEKNKRVMRNAFSAFRGTGLRQSRSAYVEVTKANIAKAGLKN